MGLSWGMELRGVKTPLTTAMLRGAVELAEKTFLPTIIYSRKVLITYEQKRNNSFWEKLTDFSI